MDPSDQQRIEQLKQLFIKAEKLGAFTSNTAALIHSVLHPSLQKQIDIAEIEELQKDILSFRAQLQKLNEGGQ
jgi:hypothetical protein